MESENNKRIKIIISPKSWIEGEAIRQLKNALSLCGMEFVVGLPDLHPGKGNPVGVDSHEISRGPVS